MRTGTVLFFLGCFLIPVSAATARQNQDSRKQTPAANAPVSPNAGPITIRGCLSGGEQAYTLVQSGTGTTFKLRGDKEEFKTLRGKQVEATAREFPPPQGPGFKTLPELQVYELRGIGDQCGLQAHGEVPPAGTPNTIPPTRNESTGSTQPNAATPRYAPPGEPQQPPKAGINPNVSGVNGAPSPGTGNPPKK